MEQCVGREQRDIEVALEGLRGIARCNMRRARILCHHFFFPFFAALLLAGSLPSGMKITNQQQLVG